MSDLTLPVGKFQVQQYQKTVAAPMPVKLPVKVQVAGEFKTLSQIEQEHIEKVLVAYPNKGKAAEVLGITTKTLYNKLHSMGLFEKYKGT